MKPMSNYRAEPPADTYLSEEWVSKFAHGSSGYMSVDDGYREALTALHAHDDLGSRLGGPTTRPKDRSRS